jgi:methylated-DNA-[protein]-cysteine S-methyltransferase
MKRIAYCLFETALGSCAIARREGDDPRTAPAVTLLQLPEATAKLTESRIARRSGARQPSAPPSQIAAVITKVCRHLQGEVQDFRDIAVDLEGTGPFDRQVYEAARKIPIGQTRTYGELARVLGRPRAARAVGQALGRNPVALIIPCHRILGAGGKPGGFSAFGGLATKASMLAIEGAAFNQPRIEVSRGSLSTLRQ